MSLWDDITESSDKQDESVVERKNPYLVDPEKGLELLAAILPGKKKTEQSDRTVRKLDEMIDKKIIDTLDEVRVQNPLQLKKKLFRLSNHLMEYKKLQLLQGKSIIGIGGQFSAGKSCFINSRMEISGEDSAIIYLPEDQAPTTAVPTYIVSGYQDTIIALSGGKGIPLNHDALNAFTHEFNNKYHIALGRFVQYLAIHTKVFPEKLAQKLVFLDTPGYSKAENATRQNVTDRKIAERQLQSADFLIWLVNVDRGTINASDLRFLKQFHEDIPFLVVFTRASFRHENALHQILDNARDLLEQEGLHPYGVTAYDSIEGKEYLGADLVEKFLDMAAQKAEKKHDLAKEMIEILNEIENDFKDTEESLKKDAKRLGRDIGHSEDILSIETLVKLYEDCIVSKEKLYADWFRYRKLRKDIMQDIYSLTSTK